jgi:aldose sugar dehydrogenase
VLSSHQILEVFLISVVASMISSGHLVHYVYAAAFSSIDKPVINDPNLKVELIFKRLNVTTTMAFLGPNDILVLEKDTGNVLRIVNGALSSPALVHVNTATEDERGMLGVAVAKQNKSGISTGGSSTFVFLYYTVYGKCENNGSAGASIAKTAASTVAANCLYKYELLGNKLVNPRLLLSLPGSPGPIHNGGKILIGPGQNIYLVIGDLYYSHRTQAQNILGGPPPDGTNGILRTTQDGLPVPNSPLGKTYPLNLYYAYGIRNSFGLDFDPVTGKLWDTENGPNYGDEINLVEPGFNSGWTQVQGIWTPNGDNAGPKNIHPSYLVNFGGKGKYRAPEFIWSQTVAPTALKFLNSTKLGKQYQNDLFVGDFNHGNLYHFKLNQNRTGFLLNGTLATKIAYTSQESKPLLFGTGFQHITDIQVGPDGYLYVLTFFGSIYKIVPRTLS